jgi:diaminopropionate ammonia-lyase
VGAKVVGVEPVTAACLGASLATGRPTSVPTPGTTMAGLDCAEVSPAAWSSLEQGIHGTIVVTDDQVADAMGELANAEIPAGESGAAPLAGLRTLMTAPACEELRAATVGARARVLLVATEGPTGR